MEIFLNPYMNPVILKRGFIKTFWINPIQKYIQTIYRGLTCSDRSENTINRKYCFRRIDIDVQSFPKDALVTKLAPCEVDMVVKS